MARVAIVTGGTRGIGAAISVALHAQGRIVVANYTGNEERARAFTEATGIATARWDVGDHDATLAAVAAIAEHHGPVEIVVNNAGITRDWVLHRMSYDDWNEVMRVNLGGCFNLAKATFPGMRERGGAALSTSVPSTGRRANMGRSTMPLPNRASTALPRRWRRKARSTASPSTPSRPAISTPTWLPRCRPRCWKRSWPRSRSAALAKRKRLRAAQHF